MLTAFHRATVSVIKCTNSRYCRSVCLRSPVTFGLLSFLQQSVTARDMRSMTRAFSSVTGWVGATPKGR